MGEPLPRAQIVDSADANSFVDTEQQLLTPFVIEMPETGPSTVLHGTWMHIGEIGVGDSARRIAIVIGTKACGCGCGSTGRAMMYTPSVDGVRELIRALEARAAATEAQAAGAAADAIAAVGGRVAAKPFEEPTRAPAPAPAPIDTARPSLVDRVWARLFGR